MNAYVARRGTDFDPFNLSPSAFWRDASAWWLTKAGEDRRIALLALRSGDPLVAGMGRNALAEARADLERARDRAEKARSYGYRLP